MFPMILYQPFYLLWILSGDENFESFKLFVAKIQFLLFIALKISSSQIVALMKYTIMLDC